MSVSGLNAPQANQKWLACTTGSSLVPARTVQGLVLDVPGAAGLGVDEPAAFGLEGKVPAVAGDAVGIASAFAGERYGGREPSDLERAKLDDAWRRARRVLMIRTLGRLIPESVRSRL